VLGLTSGRCRRDADLQHLKAPSGRSGRRESALIIRYVCNLSTTAVPRAYGAVKRVIPDCWVNTSTAPSLAMSTPTGLDPVRPKE
jgi:hypothetical protein